MPTNLVEDLLSLTADTFEDLLEAERNLATKQELVLLLENKQEPFIFRLLDSSLPGYMLLIRVEPAPK